MHRPNVYDRTVMNFGVNDYGTNGCDVEFYLLALRKESIFYVFVFAICRFLYEIMKYSYWVVRSVPWFLYFNFMYFDRHFW